VQIEIWSDIACPWCYIGKRRFEAALAGFSQRDQVEVTWRSFELDPGAPAERAGDLAEHLAAKYGASVEQMRASQVQITGLAAAEGLEFRLGDARSGNTFDAHRLVHLGAAHGLQDAVMDCDVLRRAIAIGREQGRGTIEIADTGGVSPGRPDDLLPLIPGEIGGSETHQIRPWPRRHPGG